MMFSQIIPALLISALLLTSCGDSDAKKDAPAPTPTETSDAAAPTTEQEQAAEKVHEAASTAASNLPNTPSGLKDTQDLVIKLISITNGKYSNAEVYLYGLVENQENDSSIFMGYTGNFYIPALREGANLLEVTPNLKSIKLYGRTLNSFMRRSATDQDKFVVKVKLYENKLFDVLITDSFIGWDKIRDVASSKDKSKIFSMKDDSGVKVRFELSVQESTPVPEFKLPIGPKI